MRKIFTFKKSRAVFLIALFFPLFYSCQLFFVDETKPAKIQIRKGNPDDSTLVLRTGILSAQNFKVKAGRTIQWLQKAKEVEKITNIYIKQKPGNENVFSVLPHPIPGTSDWEGTIDTTAGNKTEEYNIDWIDKDGDTLTFDPVIKVMPR